MPMNRPRVLVVEDDSKLAHLYCTALTMHGLATVCVADGAAALRSVHEQRPDMVVLDLGLPIMDGETVLRAFADDAGTCDIPIVVVTGNDPTPDLPHALRVIAKPCDPDVVAQVIVDHLARRPA